MSSTRMGDVPVKRSRKFFFEMTKTAHLPNLLRAPIESIMPKDITKVGHRMESPQFAPIVTINDLGKADELGDTVRIDIEHDLCGEPVECCEPLEGREEDMTYSTFELSIGMTRDGVKEHCSMNRKRLGKETWLRARPKLIRKMNKLKTERCIYHLMGARGHFQNGSQIIGLDIGAGKKKFAKHMKNCVMAPSYCRHFYGGKATSLDGSCGDAITEHDVFDLRTITNFHASMEESERPLPGIKMPDGSEINGLILLTPAQWRDFENSSDGTQYATWMSNAIRRGKGCGDHPMFKGECLMWKNYLVRTYKWPVRFKPGMPIEVSNNDCAGSTHIERMSTNNNFYVDRAAVLGGAAMAEALGSVVDAEGNHFGKMNYAFWQGTFDGGEGQRVHIKMMDGEKKIRFASKDGCMYDHGVAVIDTAVKMTRSMSC